jgi:hypothetical protein
MMSGLIPGSQQSRNDNDGVQIWDEHEREYFSLKTILFVTVSDSSVIRNLSGLSKNVGCRCPHYFRETDTIFESHEK